MYISTRVVLGCGFGVAVTSLIEQILISEKDKVLVVTSLGVSFAEALVSAEMLVVDKEDANLFAEEATRRRGTAPQDIHQGGYVDAYILQVTVDVDFDTFPHNSVRGSGLEPRAQRVWRHLKVAARKGLVSTPAIYLSRMRVTAFAGADGCIVKSLTLENLLQSIYYLRTRSQAGMPSYCVYDEARSIRSEE